MTFAPVLGQAAAITTLRHALAAGRVPHAYRFEGPDGVGKEKTAFALAQALVCETNEGRREGCGTCSACRRAITFSRTAPFVPTHPDVIVLERGLYPGALIGRSRDELQDLSIDQVRQIVLARLAYPPHEGRARIFLIRRAEEMNLSAANALLKSLEEPPAATYFVLLSSRPSRLLSTLRSRTVPLRFAPLHDDVMRTILTTQHISFDPLVLDLAAGSAAEAIRAADPDQQQENRAFFDAVDEAVQAPDVMPTLALSPGKDKAALAQRLGALAARLARTGREHVQDETVSLQAAQGFAVVLNALKQLERNGSPALVLETMLLRLRTLRGPVGP